MDQREYHREYMRKRRAAAKAAGIVLPSDRKTDETRRMATERMRKYRAQAAARGEELASDSWWKNNPEKHRERTARWRAANPERSAEITRLNQAVRRSTPWGKITNRLQPIINASLRGGYTGARSKYCAVLGYTWADLRAHLEAQFTDGMSWENWGDLWEIDHIRPLSTFRYDSLDHPDFKECWALANLRPLLRVENIRKFTKAA